MSQYKILSGKHHIPLSKGKGKLRFKVLSKGDVFEAKPHEAENFKDKLEEIPSNESKEDLLLVKKKLVRV